MEHLEKPELCFPHLLNTSCRKPKHQTHSELILAYCSLFSISMVTMCLNLLVIISIFHFKKLHTPTSFLLLSLAVSDFFIGLHMLLQLDLVDSCWVLGEALCSLYQYFGFFLTSASTTTIVLISYDRYVAVCRPLHYTTQVTVRRVQVYICLCWIYSMTFQAVIHLDNLYADISCAGECVFYVGAVGGVIDMICSFIVPITVIIVLYLRVFVVALSQARAMRTNVQVVKLQRSGVQNVKKSEMKAARTLGGVVVVFLTCTCPAFSVYISDMDNYVEASASLTFLECLLYFNSFLNPLIYAYFYPWFRKSIKLIVTLKILQPGSCDANIF